LDVCYRGQSRHAAYRTDWSKMTQTGGFKAARFLLVAAARSGSAFLFFRSGPVLRIISLVGLQTFILSGAVSLADEYDRLSNDRAARWLNKRLNPKPRAPSRNTLAFMGSSRRDFREPGRRP
jgi:hypothetical protein